MIAIKWLSFSDTINLKHFEYLPLKGILNWNAWHLIELQISSVHLSWHFCLWTICIPVYRHTQGFWLYFCFQHKSHILTISSKQCFCFRRLRCTTIHKLLYLLRVPIFLVFLFCINYLSCRNVYFVYGHLAFKLNCSKKSCIKYRI